MVDVFQLKKVRLRTTFASADTSSAAVKLSCCEHYGNVLHEYNNQELKAVSWNIFTALVSSWSIDLTVLVLYVHLFVGLKFCLCLSICLSIYALSYP